MKCLSQVCGEDCLTAGEGAGQGQQQHSGGGQRQIISCRGYQGFFLSQDSFAHTPTTRDLSNQDLNKLSWPPAKASNVKQSKSVTFKDC